MRPLEVKLYLSVINLPLKYKYHMLIRKQDRKQITVSEAGRLGGYSTLQNKGIKHFKKIGRKGGKRTAQLHRDLLSEFGKMGGRPKRPSMKEAMKEENR